MDVFDIRWEREFDAGQHRQYAEPGDDPEAPYFRQHAVAKQIEKIILKACGEKWKTHNDRIDGLFEDDE